MWAYLVFYLLFHFFVRKKLLSAPLNCNEFFLDLKNSFNLFDFMFDFLHIKAIE